MYYDRIRESSFAMGSRRNAQSHSMREGDSLAQVRPARSAVLREPTGRVQYSTKFSRISIVSKPGG